jgi:FAD/FMN-containing dehydrogenase
MSADSIRRLEKGAPGYEEARRAASWNALLPDRRPEQIVLARDADDVVAAVAYAREAGLTVKARSGGHSWTASGIREGSVLVDLSAMDRVEHTPGAPTAAVEPGVHGRRLNELLAADGLFFPTGHCSTVALGGFLLQGGWGWNSRSVGPACLSVEAVEVVTAAGELIRASREENPDYWWAARGAGPGFFGIVTRFHLRLYERPAAMRRSFYIYPTEVAAEVLHWAHEIGPQLPPELELGLIATTPRGPDGELVEGGAALLVNGHALMADEATARESLELLETCPVLERAQVRATQMPTDFAELYSRSDAMEQEGFRWCADNVWTDAGAEELVPVVEDLVQSVPSALSHVLWYPWHPQRFEDAAISIQGNLYLAAYAGWEDPAEDAAMSAWPRRHMERLAPSANGTALADENLVARPSRFLSPENERRLDTLRQRHDPDGRFLGYLIGDRPVGG